ncbi:MAG: nuclear transport factor 2 family protein [Verrucomicrobiota bacterium]
MSAFLFCQFAYCEEKKNDAAEIKAVVLGMNEAFSKRDIAGVLETFEEGAARVSLFKPHGPKHGPNGSESAITHGNLKEQWTAMFGLLFGVTKSYEREVTNIEVHVDKDIAVAWARMKSKMVPASGGEVSEKRFTEVLTLRKFDGEWKIAAISNNNYE